MKDKYLFLLIAFAAVVFAISPSGAAGTDPGLQGNDTADQNVIKPLTIAAQGDSSYFRGEEILFAGVNTRSDNTYMFICGPNLNPNGQKFDEFDKASVTGDEDSFAVAKVDTDSTWKYALDTGKMDFDAGTYTIYAVSEPSNKTKLTNGIYDTATIVIKRPFISAEVSEPDIKAGETLTITGTAVGDPDSVAIWVFGYDFWNGADTGSAVTVAPDPDGSFCYVLTGDETASMDGGEYFVFAQHPMYNGKLDVITKQGSDENTTGVSKREPAEGDPDPYFYVSGSYALRGADAAEALAEVINSPDIDDYYAGCTFCIEETEENQPENSQENPEPDIFSAFMNFIAGILG